MGFTLEVALCIALHDLLGRERTRPLALAALNEASGRRLSDVVAGSPALRPWTPPTSPAPDLCLVQTGGEPHLVAVLEVKAGARVNYPKVATAQDLLERREVSGGATVRALVAQDEHFPRMSQLDLYRGWPWWNEDDIVVKDLDGVRWIYFDVESADEEASHLVADNDKEERRSHSAGDWVWVDGFAFGRHLAAARRSETLDAGDQDAVAVVLWHLGFSAKAGDRSSPDLWSVQEHKSEGEESTGAPSRV